MFESRGGRQIKPRRNLLAHEIGFRNNVREDLLVSNSFKIMMTDPLIQGDMKMTMIEFLTDKTFDIFIFNTGKK